MKRLNFTTFFNIGEPEFLVPCLPGLDTSIVSSFWENLAARERFYLRRWRQHRLTPMLYRLILTKDWKEFSPWFMEVLENDYAAAIPRVAQEEEEILEILQALHQADIEVILLKGVDLRGRIYQDPIERMMTDIDLLISRDCLDRALPLMISMGYFPANSPKSLYEKLRIKLSYYINFSHNYGKLLDIDLHWEIQTSSSLARLYYKDLRQTSISRNYNGIPVRSLSPEHLLLHLCIHSLQHNFLYNNDNSDLAQKLIDIVLVIELLPINWTNFLSEVLRLHCSFSVSFVLNNIDVLLPNIIPAWVLNSIDDSYSVPRNEKVIGGFQQTINYLLPSCFKKQWQRGSVPLAFLLSRIRLICQAF